ncbi:MAG: Hsp20/alpha crystallin family protein [Acidobacteriaceae bacterium]|nr:Hsp20/alpha crystallin family protein [Acidobacteriaceae bacterium]MBV9779851.1 Hsp20/alpha crystallin family protein [Acidobacteriaceae bacterium]
MAEVDVKKSSTHTSEDKQTSKTNQTGLQRHGGGRDLSRSWGGDPFGFSLTPTDFFSANPFSLMRRMSEEMDRTFGSFFGQSAGQGSGTWFPAIEVAEENGQLHVHAELPGLKPEDVKVEVTNDSLVLRGERKSEHEHKLGGAYRSERRYGEFYREIPLPDGVNPDEAKAQFRNGVLEISVPVPQQVSNRREIPIHSGEPSSGTSRTGTTGSAASAAAGGASQSGSHSGGSAGSQRMGPSSTGSESKSKTGT